MNAGSKRSFGVLVGLLGTWIIGCIVWWMIGLSMEAFDKAKAQLPVEDAFRYVGIALFLFWVGSMTTFILGSDLIHSGDEQERKERGPWTKSLACGTYVLAFSGRVADEVYLGVKKQEAGKPAVIDLYQFPAEAFDEMKKDATRLIVRGTEKYKRMALE